MVLTIEQKGLTNNLKEILDSLPKPEDEPADKEPEDEKKDKKPGKKLHIDTLEITNVTVRAKLLPIPGKSDTIEFPLPKIMMTDVGGKVIARPLKRVEHHHAASGPEDTRGDVLQKVVTGAQRATGWAGDR